MPSTQRAATVDAPANEMHTKPVDRSTWPQAQALIDIGALFYQRNWSLGTSSNYSVVLGRDPLQLLITASGKDKRKLAGSDFVVVDAQGRSRHAEDGKPSAETMLHVVAAQQPNVGAVLHTHSVWATLLSDRFHREGGMKITGYEMLKGLSGVGTHEHEHWIEIFENTQDIADLAVRVQRQFVDTDRPLTHGFLLRRHGLYTWGRDLDEARRHVEIYEFLFEVIGRSLR